MQVVRGLSVGVCVVASALLLIPIAPSQQQSGVEYIALGDSIAAGRGADNYSQSYVQLYFGYLQSNGSGVTDVLNTGEPGIGTKQVIDEQLPRALAVINSSIPVKAVTLDIGANDIPFDKPCPDLSSAACPWAASLRTILTTLNTALAARDPGTKVQVMQYFNPAVGATNERDQRILLLGSDLKIDCAGTGASLGLNDLIHCISLEEGAAPVDVMPVFDAAGTAFIAFDRVHPNNAGHLAIAKAFGGARAPTVTPPVAPSCLVPSVTGKLLGSARRMILDANCRVGKVTRRKSSRRSGIVLTQSPKGGAVLENGARIELAVSRGHRSGIS